jgi:PhoH-like ATPase
VLDTSVLVADPGSIHSFGDADVVIPLTVIEELDSLKTRLDDVGRAARTALRAIEELRVGAGGSLAEAVPLRDGTGGTLQIEINGVQKHLLLEHGLDPQIPDNRIIGAALGQVQHGRTTMISNDAALRIKAAHLGLDAAEHRPVGRSIDTRDTGWCTIQTSASTIDALYAAGAVDTVDVVDVLDAADAFDAAETGSVDGAATEDARAAAAARVSSARENAFAVLRAGSQSALVRRLDDEWVLLPHQPPEAWGLRARSKEQRFALELLLDPDVSVVALDGRAGTGKTVLAIAAGLEQVVEHRAFERLAIYRPLVPVGRADVGFLPGGLDEKLDPWMAAIHDAIVALTDQRSSHDAHRLIDELTTRNQLSLESVTFLRGRSLHRQIVIVDEAQNLEPTTLKTILTRIGEGTKVVFTGDTSQIDAPYLGESNNALAVLIQAFGGQRCFGHVTLTACERSTVASLAAELL